MATQRTIALRRTITPYVGQTIILIGVTVFMLYVRLEKPGLFPPWPIALIWGLYACYVFLFCIKYRVLWNESSVTMKAAGCNRDIPFDEITDMRYEVADPSEFLAQSRPFRRIVIRGRSHAGDARVDVSLRHFRRADIEELLTAIRRSRPDLTVPQIPS